MRHQSSLEYLLLTGGVLLVALGIGATLTSTGSALLDQLKGAGLSTPNNPPSVTILSPSNNTTFTAPASVTVTWSASDPDSDPLTFTVDCGNGHAAQTTSTSHTCSYSSAGNYTITVTASDGNTTTSDSVYISVTSSECSSDADCGTSSATFSDYCGKDNYYGYWYDYDHDGGFDSVVVTCQNSCVDGNCQSCTPQEPQGVWRGPADNQWCSHCASHEGDDDRYSCSCKGGVWYTDHCCGDDVGELNGPNLCPEGYVFDEYNCSCKLSSEICFDGIDNDGDGLTDCSDPDCAGQDGPNGVVCCQSDADCAFLNSGGGNTPGCDDPEANIYHCSSNICDLSVIDPDIHDQCAVCDVNSGDIISIDFFVDQSSWDLSSITSLVEDCQDTCVDQDDGNYFKRGFTIDLELCSSGDSACPETIHFDECLDGATLREWRCDNDDAVYEDVSCSSLFDAEISGSNCRTPLATCSQDACKLAGYTTVSCDVYDQIPVETDPHVLRDYEPTPDTCVSGCSGQGCCSLTEHVCGERLGETPTPEPSTTYYHSCDTISLEGTTYYCDENVGWITSQPGFCVDSTPPKVNLEYHMLDPNSTGYLSVTCKVTDEHAVTVDLYADGDVIKSCQGDNGYAWCNATMYLDEGNHVISCKAVDEYNNSSEELEALSIYKYPNYVSGCSDGGCSTLTSRTYYGRSIGCLVYNSGSGFAVVDEGTTYTVRGTQYTCRKSGYVYSWVEAGDTVPPTVTISLSTYPGFNSSGLVIQVSCSASDNEGVSSVSVVLDGQEVNTCTGSSYCNESLQLGPGSHQVSCKAVDLSENVGYSEAKTVESYKHPNYLYGCSGGSCLGVSSDVYFSTTAGCKRDDAFDPVDTTWTVDGTVYVCSESSDHVYEWMNGPVVSLSYDVNLGDESASVDVNCGASSTLNVYRISIYLDGNEWGSCTDLSGTSAYCEKVISVSPGEHELSCKAWDSLGRYGSASDSVIVYEYPNYLTCYVGSTECSEYHTFSTPKASDRQACVASMSLETSPPFLGFVSVGERRTVDLNIYECQCSDYSCGWNNVDHLYRYLNYLDGCSGGYCQEVYNQTFTGEVSGCRYTDTSGGVHYASDGSVMDLYGTKYVCTHDGYDYQWKEGYVHSNMITKCANSNNTVLSNTETVDLSMGCLLMVGGSKYYKSVGDREYVNTSCLPGSEEVEVECKSTGRKYYWEEVYSPVSERCDNGVDDDGDGAIDCYDGDCIGKKGPNGYICCVTSSDCPPDGWDAQAKEYRFYNCSNNQCLYTSYKYKYSNFMEDCSKAGYIDVGCLSLVESESYGNTPGCKVTTSSGDDFLLEYALAYDSSSGGWRECFYDENTHRYSFSFFTDTYRTPNFMCCCTADKCEGLYIARGNLRVHLEPGCLYLDSETNYYDLVQEGTYKYARDVDLFYKCRGSYYTGSNIDTYEWISTTNYYHENFLDNCNEDLICSSLREDVPEAYKYSSAGCLIESFYGYDHVGVGEVGIYYQFSTEYVCTCEYNEGSYYWKCEASPNRGRT